MGDIKDSMQQTCEDRARRHLANAIAYSKELLSEEGEELRVDYRSDILGEICAAEHQLSLDKKMAPVAEALRSIRVAYELNEYVPDKDLIAELRRLWGLTMEPTPIGTTPKSVSDILKQTKNARFIGNTVGDLSGPSPYKQKLPTGLDVIPEVDVLILPGNNDSELSGIHRMITNLDGVNSVFEGELPAKTTEYLLVWPPHTGIIRPIAAGTNYPAFRRLPDGSISWSYKPQLVKAEYWRRTPDLDKLMSAEPLKWDFLTGPCVELINKVNKICCGTKGRFRHGAYFVAWSETNWGLLRNFLNDNMEWKE